MCSSEICKLLASREKVNCNCKDRTIFLWGFILYLCMPKGLSKIVLEEYVCIDASDLRATATSFLTAFAPPALSLSLNCSSLSSACFPNLSEQYRV